MYTSVFSVLARLPADSERSYLDLTFLKERATLLSIKGLNIPCLKGPARALKDLYKH